MDAEFKVLLAAANEKTQYDTYAKRLLSRKCILSYILTAVVDEQLLGRHRWKGKLDLLNIVLLGVPNEMPKQDDSYELHRLLSTLFGVGLGADERIDILENEYDIDARAEFGEEFEEMCNLSQGIWERGIEQGIGRGELRKLIDQCCCKLAKGKPTEEIADALECDLSQINAIVEVAQKYAPDYDVDRILEELCGETQQ